MPIPKSKHLVPLGLSDAQGVQVMHRIWPTWIRRNQNDYQDTIRRG